MPLYKGKDQKEERAYSCGCMIKHYPIGEGNDLLDWMVVRRGMNMEDKWQMQEHRHPDFEEYWFVLEGKGQIICGDEIYDVEPGDMVITPRGVPHRARGDMTFLCTMSKHNVWGQTIGHKLQYEATEAPYRDEPGLMPKVGEYKELPR